MKLTVFDGLGREVGVLVDRLHSPGTYSVTFDASHLENGVYYYRIETGDIMQTRKMLLVK